MGRIHIVFLCILLAFTAVMSQEVTLQPHGISPASVKADTLGNPNYTGIFDQRYNALLNVGVQTKMYLKGSSDTTLSSPTFTVVSKPAGSTTAITNIVDIDDMKQIAVFTPDAIGTYVVEFSDGAATAELTINAGLYEGIESGRCGLCHSGTTEEWMGTGHSDFLDLALEGEKGSYYSASCIECHTVGYDLNANNDGFDDFDFVFPSSLEEGTLAAVTAAYPSAMARANIQCESCHGPASEHFGVTDDNAIIKSLDPMVCAYCHDDDHYHVYPSQWEASAHSELPGYPGGSRTNCQGCHNGAQFIQFVDGETITAQPFTNHTCAVCHDPHSAENEVQLRTMDATLSNDEMASGAGRGAICMNCHQSRQNAATYTNAPAGHYGPHYAPQADMLIGTNVANFGVDLPTSPHLGATENACVTCHMYEAGSHSEHDAEGNLNTSGMHSFSMVNKSGIDNVGACADCHGDVGESFDHKKYYMNGVADHDGDGVEEGLQEEVHGLMETLAELLPVAEGNEIYDAHDDPDSTWTKTELKAAFNQRMVYYDHSYGIHNPAFTVALLKVSIQALLNHAIEGEIVAIDDVPNDQGKQIRIIWDKFVDDGIAVDPIQTYIVKRYDADDDVWVGVGEHTADGSMRYALVVPTVYDSTASDMGMTTFKVVAVTQGSAVHESTPAEGYSVDNLVPMAPQGVMASLEHGDVYLSWEEAQDVDFNYFAIYRSDVSGFVPSEETLVATVASTEFVDTELLNDKTYYYKLSAFDFSGNESTYSDQVSLVVTGINDGPGNVPTEFTLAQNYPNPFNPTTMIKFGVPAAENVTIKIYDIRGSLVRTLADGKFAPGYHSVAWDGRNDNGLQVSAGTYLYRLESESTNIVNKMVLLK